MKPAAFALLVAACGADEVPDPVVVALPPAVDLGTVGTLGGAAQVGDTFYWTIVDGAQAGVWSYQIGEVEGAALLVPGAGPGVVFGTVAASATSVAWGETVEGTGPRVVLLHLADGAAAAMDGPFLAAPGESLTVDRVLSVVGDEALVLTSGGGRFQVTRVSSDPLRGPVRVAQGAGIRLCSASAHEGAFALVLSDAPQGPCHRLVLGNAAGPGESREVAADLVAAAPDGAYVVRGHDGVALLRNERLIASLPDAADGRLFDLFAMRFGWLSPGLLHLVDLDGHVQEFGLQADLVPATGWLEGRPTRLMLTDGAGRLQLQSFQ
jgi:hypothetical protein